MNVLMHALGSEALKMKRTLAFWMVLVAPLVVSVLIFLLHYMRSGDNQRPSAPGGGWMKLSLEIMGLWSVLMLPLFITLEAALLGGLEHAEKQWKHLFALPAPRWSIYTAKLIVCASLILLSNLVLCIGVVAVGLSLERLVPRLGISGSIPFVEILEIAAKTWLASWLIIALHTWVSLRWRSFTVAVGFGMAATVASFIVSQSEQWGKFYPWSLPMHSFGGEGRNTTLALTI